MTRRTRDALVWDAHRFALSGYPTDIADVAVYVTSRGQRAVEQFWAELDQLRTRLRDAGVVETIRPGGVTNTDARVADLAPPEVDRCLDGLILLGGPDFFEDLVTDPAGSLSGGPLPFPDLAGAFARAVDDPRTLDGPLWEIKKGDMRRDGQPWLVVTAVRDDLTDGVTQTPSDGFHEQFQQLGTQAAFSDPWRRLRDALGVKTLDILVDYGGVFSDEPFEVTRKRRALDVTVQRQAPELADRGADPTGQVAPAARREAVEVLRFVHEQLAKDVAVTQ